MRIVTFYYQQITIRKEGQKKIFNESIDQVSNYKMCSNFYLKLESILVRDFKLI